MAKKKAPLGFQTPSMQIQEEYKEILERIKKKEANWGEILTDALHSTDDVFKGTDDFIKETKSKVITHEVLMELEHRTLLSVISMTQVMIAEVGKELAECDVRIAKVETALKELRKALK